MPIFNAPPGSSDPDDLSFEGKATQMEIREMMCEEEFATATKETPSLAGWGDGDGNSVRDSNAIHIDNDVQADNVVQGNHLHSPFTIFRDNDILPSIPQPTLRQPPTQPLALHRIDEEPHHHRHHHRASQASQAIATATAIFTPHTHTRSKSASTTTRTQPQAQCQTPKCLPSPANATAEGPLEMPKSSTKNQNENDENVLPSDCVSLIKQLEHLGAARRALLARVSRIEGEEGKVLLALSTAIQPSEQNVRNEMERLSTAGAPSRLKLGDGEGATPATTTSNMLGLNGTVAKNMNITMAVDTRPLPVPLSEPASTPPTPLSHSSLSARRSRIPLPIPSSPPLPAHKPSFTAPTFTSESRRRQRCSEDDSPVGGVGGSRGKWVYDQAKRGMGSVKKSTATTTTTTTAFLPLKIGRSRGRGGPPANILGGRSAHQSQSQSRSQTALPRATTSKTKYGSASATATAGGRSTRPAGAGPGAEPEIQISETAERLGYVVPKTVARKEWAF